jgi:hypothetical protein
MHFPPVSSFLFGPNTILSILFSDTLSLGSTHRDKFSHLCRTTGKVVVLYILIYYISVCIKQMKRQNFSGLNSNKYY